MFLYDQQKTAGKCVMRLWRWTIIGQWHRWKLTIHPGSLTPPPLFPVSLYLLPVAFRLRELSFCSGLPLFRFVCSFSLFPPSAFFFFFFLNYYYYSLLAWAFGRENTAPHAVTATSSIRSLFLSVAGLMPFISAPLMHSRCRITIIKTQVNDRTS